MERKISLEQLYFAIKQGIKEGKDIPSFDGTGKRDGTITHAELSDILKITVKTNNGMSESRTLY